MELKHVRFSTSVFTVAGIVMGFASYMINYDIISVFLGFAVMIVIFSVLRKKLNRKAKFFLGDAQTKQLHSVQLWCSC